MIWAYIINDKALSPGKNALQDDVVPCLVDWNLIFFSFFNYFCCCMQTMLCKLHVVQEHIIHADVITCIKSGRCWDLQKQTQNEIKLNTFLPQDNPLHSIWISRNSLSLSCSAKKFFHCWKISISNTFFSKPVHIFSTQTTYTVMHVNVYIHSLMQMYQMHRICIYLCIYQ